jgi:3-hydroxyisobutyrate dehydrogenase-like beta-hydroxyacid dehydrogenase
MSVSTIGVLGLGEAGSAIACDLLTAGAKVRGFDPQVAAPPGAYQAADDADASATSALVIALTSGHEAEETLRLALPGLPRGAHYADLNTGPANLKARLAAIAAEAGVLFTDVALMSPVPGKGIRTPMLVSGTGAERFAETFSALGATVEIVAGVAGSAATRKLVRSVYYKDWAAAVTEHQLTSIGDRVHRNNSGVRCFGADSDCRDFQAAATT